MAWGGPDALAPRRAGLPPRSPAVRLRACATRLALAAACSLGAAWVHEHHDPGTLCPLRRLTGIPCPLCGSTSAFTAAGAGHWYGALAANPFTVLGVLLLLAAPALPADPVRAWTGLPYAWRWGPLAAVVAASWLWQLHRFGFL
jgi:hypothetical protein